MGYQGCGDEPKCLRCGSMGCIKCPVLIIEGARMCVDTCPTGLTAGWSVEPDYMGRVCRLGGPAGLSGAGLAAIIGACAGAMMCFLIIVIGLVFVKCKKPTKNAHNQIDTLERREFLKELDYMRPQSHCLLAVLNDLRRQIRELHVAGDSNAAITFWPVVRDLAKLLLLLNRPPETIPMAPHDWKRLYEWADKLLARYKRASTDSHPQVAQLVNFLQSPVPLIKLANNYIQTPMSTFKPNGFGSSISLQDFVDPFKDGIMNPNWQFPNNVGIPNNGSSLWLEDEFFQLGYRPQDEITTEL